ncbi:DUF6526 family protein [Flavobacterium litorale]|uniref:ABC transporter permease n=1 Tax=Flavobacterium litorale TaxID=2856519 RepID=A0ABX8VAG3_9FLAO|nr:DUF6526 family protein [Flavobacterium litorale]QYJ68188.1 hypothetical protein K1I41_11770 [Flavobacterium litorale]
MAQQSNKNHLRFYAPHHFVFYPFMLAVLSGTIYYAWSSEKNQMLWLFMALIAGAIIWLSFMTRQHYALTLQDRIIMQEMRYRYFVVTGNRFEPLEEELSKAQIFALRFASDNELETLATKAVQEKLSAGAIKKEISNWRADNNRV